MHPCIEVNFKLFKLNAILNHHDGSARTRAVGADQALREATLPCTPKLKRLTVHEGVDDVVAGDAGEPWRRECHIHWPQGRLNKNPPNRSKRASAQTSRRTTHNSLKNTPKPTRTAAG